MRPMDADKTGAGLGLPVLVALCGALLGRNTRGGTIVVGALNLGGSIEMIPNAVRIAELAIDKQAQTLLMPVSARRQLNDLPDELWTKISIEFYKDACRRRVQGAGGVDTPSARAFQASNRAREASVFEPLRAFDSAFS